MTPSTSPALARARRPSALPFDLLAFDLLALAPLALAPLALALLAGAAR